MDGEGCFSWQKSTKPYQGTARLSCSNTYPLSLYILKKAFGGNVVADRPPKGNRRGCWKWYVTGALARRALRRLIPYLEEKQEQALLLLWAAKVPPVVRMPVIKALAALKRREYSNGDD